jgi:hypothetical protein
MLAAADADGIGIVNTYLDGDGRRSETDQPAAAVSCPA